MVKLDVMAIGISVGSLWGSFVFLLGIFTRGGSGYPNLVKLFARVYLGYSNTFMGSIVGGTWGFIDGAISGMVVAWILNKVII